MLDPACLLDESAGAGSLGGRWGVAVIGAVYPRSLQAVLALVGPEKWVFWVEKLGHAGWEGFSKKAVVALAWKTMSAISPVLWPL